MYKSKAITLHKQIICQAIALHFYQSNKTTLSLI